MAEFANRVYPYPASNIMIQIIMPATPQDLDDVRVLMRAFHSWQRARHPQDLDLIDDHFDPIAFEHELASLPGQYSLPDGQLLLALVDKRPAGCVGLRKIDASSCEMKRMFVYPQYHGRGVGRALAEAVIEAARHANYRVMRLDHSVRQTEAQNLYTRLGFRMTGPYYELSDELRSRLVFMELEL
jgi:GNAT superfamily N-acetyltransferase